MALTIMTREEFKAKHTDVDDSVYEMMFKLHGLTREQLDKEVDKGLDLTYTDYVNEQVRQILSIQI